MAFKLDANSLGLIFKKIKSAIPSKTSELTNDSGFITTSDIPEGAAASTTVPKMAGTAAAGTEMAFARGDHIHPSDTTRVPVSRTINGKDLSKDINLSASDVGAATAAEVATAKAEAKQEAIDAILGGNVSADFDTLQEVATWIQNDTTDSAQLMNRVSAIEGNYVKNEDLTALTSEEIDNAWNNA